MSNNPLVQTPRDGIVRITPAESFKDDGPFAAWLRGLADVVNNVDREWWRSLDDCTEILKDVPDVFFKNVPDGFVVYEWLEDRNDFLSAHSGLLEFERTKVVDICKKMILKYGTGGEVLEPAAVGSLQILCPLWYIVKPTEFRPSEVELHLHVQMDVGGKQTKFAFQLVHFLFSRKSYQVTPDFATLYAYALSISDGQSASYRSYLGLSHSRLDHSHGGPLSVSSMQQMTAGSSEQPVTTQDDFRSVLSEVGMVAYSGSGIFTNNSV